MSYLRDAPPPAATVRRRGETLVSAIREAALSELVEHGYASMTFEGVARRAKTSKPVLYRRYRSRAHMVVDALTPFLQTPIREGLGKSLRDDLLLLLDPAANDRPCIDGDSFRKLLADLDDELLDNFYGMGEAWAEKTVSQALSDARDRGEIGGAPIPDRAATCILALLRNEMMFTHNPVDLGIIADMLDDVYLPLITTLSHRSKDADGA